MAAPTTQQSASSSFSGTRSPSITFSTAPAADDLIVLFISSQAQGAVWASLADWDNPLGGTTAVASDAHVMGARMHFVTSAEAGASTVTWTLTNLFSNSQTGAVHGVIVRGAHPNLPVDQITTGFSSANTVTPHVVPGLTGSGLYTDSLVVASLAKDATGAYVATNPTGWTQIQNTNTNQARVTLTLNAATTAGGDVASVTVAPSSGDEYAGITIALASVDAVISAGAGSGAVTWAGSATGQRPASYGFAGRSPVLVDLFLYATSSDVSTVTDNWDSPSTTFGSTPSAPWGTDATAQALVLSPTDIDGDDSLAYAVSANEIEWNTQVAECPFWIPTDEPGSWGVGIWLRGDGDNDGIELMLWRDVNNTAGWAVTRFVNGSATMLASGAPPAGAWPSGQWGTNTELWAQLIINESNQLTARASSDGLSYTNLVPSLEIGPALKFNSKIAIRGYAYFWDSGAYPSLGADDYGTGDIQALGIAYGGLYGPAQRVEWVGSATGSRPAGGSAAGAVSWAGSATGEAPPSGGAAGSASGAVSWDGTATGARVASGSVAGAITWAGSATGAHVASGSVAGAVSWIGSATGANTPAGSVAGAVTWDGTATGEAPAVGQQEGSANGAVSWDGTATGTHLASGSAGGAITWGGAATGSRSSSGSVAGAVSWVGSATGGLAAQGSAAGAVTWIGSARGTIAAAHGSITWDGGASGTTSPIGASSGSVTWVGTATGITDYAGEAAGAVLWGVGTASGSTEAVVADAIHLRVDSEDWELSVSAFDWSLEASEPWGLRVRHHRHGAHVRDTWGALVVGSGS